MVLVLQVSELMDLKIDYKITKDANEAFSSSKNVVNEKFIKSFGISADVIFDDAKKRIVAKGSGFTLDAFFKERFVEISLDLSFLFRPFKGKVLKEISDRLDKII